MVEKEVKFRLSVDDQATAKLQEIKAQVDAFGQTSYKMSSSISGNAPRDSVGTISPSGNIDKELKDFSMMIAETTNALRNLTSTLSYSPPKKAGSEQHTSKSGGDEFHKMYKNPPKGGGGAGEDSENALVPGRWARPLRAVGAYRTAWFAGQDMSGAPMKAAAGIFILQAMGDTMKKILDAIVSASPALKAEMKILRIVFDQLLRPIGDVVAAVLRPLARTMIQSNANLRSVLAEKGYKPGTTEYLSAYYKGMTHQFYHMLTGKSVISRREYSEDVIPNRSLLEDYFGSNEQPAYKEFLKMSDTLEKKLGEKEMRFESLSPMEKDLSNLISRVGKGGFQLSELWGGKSGGDLWKDFTEKYYDKSGYAKEAFSGWDNGSNMPTQDATVQAIDYSNVLLTQIRDGIVLLRKYPTIQYNTPTETQWAMENAMATGRASRNSAYNESRGYGT